MLTKKLSQNEYREAPAALGERRADLSRPVQKTISHHPQVRERKQRKELLRVFHQATVAQLHMTKLAFDGAFFEYQACLGQMGIDDLQELLSEPVFFQQMPKASAEN